MMTFTDFLLHLVKYQQYGKEMLLILLTALLLIWKRKRNNEKLSTETNNYFEGLWNPWLDGIQSLNQFWNTTCFFYFENKKTVKTTFLCIWVLQEKLMWQYALIHLCSRSICHCSYCCFNFIIVLASSLLIHAFIYSY